MKIDKDGARERERAPKIEKKKQINEGLEMFIGKRGYRRTGAKKKRDSQEDKGIVKVNPKIRTMRRWRRKVWQGSSPDPAVRRGRRVDTAHQPRRLVHAVDVSVEALLAPRLRRLQNFEAFNKEFKNANDL